MREGMGAAVHDTRPSVGEYAPPRVEHDRQRPLVLEVEHPVVRVVERPPSEARERNARLNVRRHLLRASLRGTVLLATDAAVAVLTYSALVALPVASIGPALGQLPVWQFAVALPLALVLTGNYGVGDSRRNPGMLFVGAALATMLPLWGQLWNAQFLTAGAMYAATLLALFGALLGARLLVDATVRWQRSARGSHTAARTLLVGNGSLCSDVYHRGDLTADGGFEVVGFVDTDMTTAAGALGHVDELLAILHDQRIDTVALCGQVSERAFSRVIKAATSAECNVIESHQTLSYAGVRPDVVWRSGRPFIELRAITIRVPNLLVKRAFDIVVSGVAMIVLSPVAALLALAVRFGGPGPIVFGHARLGRHGRYFKCYKFRTMVPNADQVLRSDPALYALYLQNDCKLPPDIDTRITPIGRFLRKTSLDELPQLWNVFRGDMSLVGPRPLVPEEMSFYGEEEPLLLSLRPGVTGLWQVVGRSSVKYPARAQLELEYVQTWSLAKDLRILLMTIPAVLAQRGAH